MAERRSTAQWRSGSPLNEAWLTFAPAELRAEYEGAWASQPPIQSAFSADRVGWVARIGQTLGAVGVAVGAVATAMQARKLAEDALKASLASRIADGEFEVLGYRMEPSKSRTPVLVSNPNFNKCPPDWANETLEIRGEYYVEITIAPAAHRPPKAKMGRPGSRDLIIDAIQDLRSRPNSNFCVIKRKVACERVREYLSESGVDVSKDGAGLSPVNISKLIAEMCGKKKL